LNVVKPTERSAVIEVVPAIREETPFEDVVGVLAGFLAYYAFMFVAREYAFPKFIAGQQRPLAHNVPAYVRLGG
jgi:hypothetical protein